MYWTFKGGLAFSPKTALNSTPIYVKEHLATKDVSYSDAITNKQGVQTNPYHIIDLFIQNNADNNKLAPYFNIKKDDRSVTINYNQGGHLTITEGETLNRYQNTPYLKTRYGKNTYLWKMTSQELEDPSNPYSRVIRV